MLLRVFSLLQTEFYFNAQTAWTPNTHTKFGNSLVYKICDWYGFGISIVVVICTSRECLKTPAQCQRQHVAKLTLIRNYYIAIKLSFNSLYKVTVFMVISSISLQKYAKSQIINSDFDIPTNVLEADATYIWYSNCLLVKLNHVICMLQE